MGQLGWPTFQPAQGELKQVDTDVPGSGSGTECESTDDENERTDRAAVPALQPKAIRPLKKHKSSALEVKPKPSISPRPTVMDLGTPPPTPKPRPSSGPTSAADLASAEKTLAPQKLEAPQENTKKPRGGRIAKLKPEDMPRFPRAVV